MVPQNNFADSLKNSLRFITDKNITGQLGLISRLEESFQISGLHTFQQEGRIKQLFGPTIYINTLIHYPWSPVLAELVRLDFTDAELDYISAFRFDVLTKLTSTVSRGYLRTSFAHVKIPW